MGFALSSMQLRSKSFDPGGAIPSRHTKTGDNISPPLHWIEPPAEAESFALICYDPDAPRLIKGEYGFVHWVLYNIPKIDELFEGTDIGVAGTNSFGELGYGGPKPPADHGVHHYFFILFALRSAMDLAPGLTAKQMLEQIESDVIAINRLVGTYEIKKIK